LRQQKNKSDDLNLTESELDFLRSQGLSLLDIFDCRGRSIAACKDEAKKIGQRILLHGTCSKGGHRLKTRYGHCVQCDTSKIAFQGRKSASGVVYVMYSHKAKLTKIGYSANIDIREDKVRYDSLAGATDWTLVFYLRSGSAGRLELEVHRSLSEFRVKETYVKDGKNQTTRECYACRPLLAVNKIVIFAKVNDLELVSHWRLERFNWDAVD
jgi:hypothetical protein